MDHKTIAYLERIGACFGAIEWVETQNTLEQAWANCKRGDWLAWYVFRIGAAGEPWSEERKPFVMAMCKCARLGLKYAPKGEDRPRKCILTTERWTQGKATKEEVGKAALVSGAAWAAGAAGASEAAAGVAEAAEAAGDRVHAKCADIIRRYYPQPPKANRRGD